MNEYQLAADIRSEADAIKKAAEDLRALAATISDPIHVLDEFISKDLGVGYRPHRLQPIKDGQLRANELATELLKRADKLQTLARAMDCIGKENAA